MIKSLICVFKKIRVCNKNTSGLMLTKQQKAEFADVNEHFCRNRNEKIGFFLQTLIILAVVILFLTACKKESKLTKSVWIHDSEFPDLPAYSEWGYNTFGTYYDGEAFISESKTPSKVIFADSMLSFILQGIRETSSSYLSHQDMALTFKLSGLTIQHYSDLTILNDTIINLKDSTCQVIVTIDSTQHLATILDGELQIKRVQNLFVDRNQVEVILSGYFEFRAIINGTPITVSDGRFDVGIGSGNCYIYQNP